MPARASWYTLPPTPGPERAVASYGLAAELDRRGISIPGRCSPSSRRPAATSRPRLLGGRPSWRARPMIPKWRVRFGRRASSVWIAFAAQCASRTPRRAGARSPQRDSRAAARDLRTSRQLPRQGQAGLRGCRDVRSSCWLRWDPTLSSAPRRSCCWASWPRKRPVRRC